MPVKKRRMSAYFVKQISETHSLWRLAKKVKSAVGEVDHVLAVRKRKEVDRSVLVVVGALCIKNVRFFPSDSSGNRLANVGCIGAVTDTDNVEEAFLRRGWIARGAVWDA